MTERLKGRLAAVVCFTAVLAIVCSPLAYAAGLWWGFPQIGGASYCVSYSAYPATTTTPGTLPTPNQCNATAPAGPAVFLGYENVPVDIYGPGAPVTNVTPSQAYVELQQLGNGPYVVNSAPGTAITLGNTTSFYIVQGGQGSAWTITMPPNPIEGQIVHIVCGYTTGGTLTVAGNTNQSVVGNPNAVCTVGNAGFNFRYVASSTTWYRF